MPLVFYKILHLVAIFSLFLALGASLGGAADGRSRRVAGLTHGLALVVILVSGFGMLARLEIAHDWLFPPWVWGKLVLWGVFGALAGLLSRRPRLRAHGWWLLPLLGLGAALLALLKPG